MSLQFVRLLPRCVLSGHRNTSAHVGSRNDTASRGDGRFHNFVIGHANPVSHGRRRQDRGEFSLSESITNGSPFLSPLAWAPLFVKEDVSLITSRILLFKSSRRLGFHTTEAVNGAGLVYTCIAITAIMYRFFWGVHSSLFSKRDCTFESPAGMMRNQHVLFSAKSFLLMKLHIYLPVVANRVSILTEYETLAEACPEMASTCSFRLFGSRAFSTVTAISECYLGSCVALWQAPR